MLCKFSYKNMELKSKNHSRWLYLRIVEVEPYILKKHIRRQPRIHSLPSRYHAWRFKSSEKKTISWREDLSKSYNQWFQWGMAVLFNEKQIYYSWSILRIIKKYVGVSGMWISIPQIWTLYVFKLASFWRRCVKLGLDNIGILSRRNIEWLRLLEMSLMQRIQTVKEANKFMEIT